MSIKSKIILFATLVLFVLIGLSCVSAADNQTGDVVATENEIEMDELQADADVGTFAQLKSEINAAQDEIKLNRSYTYAGSGDIDVIEISKDIVIDGQGHTIDADGKAGIFSFSGTATLKNINFVNGRSSISPIILKQGRIENCNFTNLTSTSTNAVYCGGAISISHGTILNSNFIDCKSNKDGGAIRYGATSNALNVEGCTFINNQANNGGVLFSDGAAKWNFKNCTFIKNHANTNGGALYGDKFVDMNLDGCIFEDNFAKTGGAIYMVKEQTIKNCNFKGNNATTGTGGAIYSNGALIIYDSNFTDNHAENQGAAILAKGFLTLNGSIFTGNNANLYAVCGQNGGNVDNCTFIKNGNVALAFTKGTVTVNNSNFVENCGQAGSGIYVESSGNVNVFNSNFTKNEGQDAPAAYFLNYANLDGCNFIYNTGTSACGAVLFTDGGNVNNCNFTNNSGQFAGALRFGASSVVSNSNFIGNIASSAGAVYSPDGLTFKNSNFIKNVATTGNGGAVSLQDGGTFDNCIFTGNSAGRYGGAVYSQGTISVNKSEFKNNRASYGGAVYVLADSSFENSRFIENKADVYQFRYYGTSGITFEFMGFDNYINAIYTENSVFTFSNVTYWNGNEVNSDDVVPVNFMCSGINITVEVYDLSNILVENVTLMTDNSNQAHYSQFHLPDGGYTLKAYHADDAYYAGSETLSIGITLNRDPSSVEINIDDGAVLYNVDRITFDVVNRTEVTVVITSAEGDVLFNQTVDENYVLLDLPGSEDYFNITVYNAGSINYMPSKDTKRFKLDRFNSTIRITPFEDVTYGNTISVEVTGENLTKINVTVYNGTDVLFSQIVEGTTFEIPVLPAGQYNLTVTNKGNRTVRESSDSTLFNILKAPAAASVSVENVTYGRESVIVVNANLDGVCTVDVNGTAVKVTVSGGRGESSISLGAGSYYANVTIDNPNYETIATNALFEVFKAQTVASVSVGNVVYGNESVIVVVGEVDGVYAVDVNGTVVEVTVSDGKGNSSISLGAGSYYANVTFVNGNYSTVATNAKFEVFKAQNVASVSVGNVGYGIESVIVVVGEVDGVYAVDVNGTVVEVTVSGGRGESSISLGAGSYYANATFCNSNYTSDITNATFEVLKAFNNVIVTVEDVLFGEEVFINVTADVDGVYSVDVNGTIIPVTVVNGIGNASLALPAGSYYANVTFDNPNCDSNITNTTFNVIPKVIPPEPTPVDQSKIVAKDLTAFYNKVSYSVTVYGKEGKVAAGVSVTFKINGKKVGVAKTNSNGVATIKLNQLPKTYKITSEAIGKSVTKKLTVKQVLTLKKVKVKKSAKKLVLTATLKEGKKALKGKKITFRFNGKKIKTVKTNKKGIAKATVKKSMLKKLRKGKKVTYKATYLKDTVKRTVKVKR